MSSLEFDYEPNYEHPIEDDGGMSCLELTTPEDGGDV
jgi:hypothetical protein